MPIFVGSNNNTETMNNAQSLNGANIEVGMTLLFDGFQYQKGHYQLEVNYREELFDGEILLKGKVSRIFKGGGCFVWTFNGAQLLNPNKKYQVLN